MSREAEAWAYWQTWCAGSTKFILVAMCRRARGWTYAKPLSLIAVDTGMSLRTVKAAISLFLEVQRAASPKRGTWVFMGEGEVQPAAPPELETPDAENPDKENPSPSPRPPSISKEISTTPPAREGQQSFLEIPEWATTINEIAEFSGGQPLTEKHIASIKERAGTLDLKVMAMEFDSHHRIKQSKKKYETFSTFGRVGTWLKNALEDADSGFSRQRTRTTETNRGATSGPRAPVPGEPVRTLQRRT